MGLSGSAWSRGGGALRELTTVGIEFTTSSEAVTVVSGKGQRGFTVGNFSTGVATLTFPDHISFLAGVGHANTDSATAGSRQVILVNNVSYANGTATLRCTDGADGDTEAIANGTYRLVLQCGES